MESAVSHNLASQFSSVPKAFDIARLKYYLNHRMYHRNNINLRYLYISALNCPKSKNQRYIKKPIDLSMFEKRNRFDKSTSSNFIKSIIARN